MNPAISTVSTTSSGVNVDEVSRRPMALTTPMAKATPTTKRRMGTPRVSASDHSPSPTSTANRTVLPLMLATKMPARVMNPTASTKPATGARR